ncbi:type II toxin-antitoxin system RelE/ParE family toxin [Merismopedia glauca]|uniref:Type II toxin-antitoxin system RelE/ParE family toxin n=1 Tax=Merismopedia glauca CCAP 1448/3 TaxID=1296344 RepID=A0A2T1BYE1_9CYAN|nr:type II toxin-antitoxin system RelE/ParE family toxin [Merismopedia glauca]PSB01029.1 type II toxin-antitoxin system RelE/ParE family toxin [Merismopedia glauca CCAP 1448/3]
MKQHIISPEATQDLESIIDYFATYNIEAGERFLNDFSQKCKYLANFPNMGRSYADIKENLRGLPIDSYIIFYRPTNTGIEIIRVVSGYRNLESLFTDSVDD